ncbi:Retrovirus-related Pol poly from transposon [Brachionus plicatilis]|uniref:Retrovirus-related Pol poly from transposon n=1 Tax=Brachionus plicatilis TaxID=10195 RepID=A0A3M7QEJ9_BRAPC|nr:Retrovirus-related Pol poly from transposon [Brachionus plicatilis]
MRDIKKAKRLREPEYKELEKYLDMWFRDTKAHNSFRECTVVERIVNQVHSTIYNGHLGKSKTKSKITDRFYRPFLKDDIMRCVKCCDVCQKIKLTQPARHAELIYLTPCRPNQLITTDLAGLFPVTHRGNKYLQVIVDHFTKPIQIHALNISKIPPVANFIKWNPKL